ncbi:hypothetical protein HDZ31DRAFT_72606 [Schizophyllum fasciatum]
MDIVEDASPQPASTLLDFGQPMQDDSRDRDLPVEICDIIISHVLNNPRVLRACSRVCRTWSQSARRHLFHRVTVAPPGQKGAYRFLEQPPNTCTFFHLIRTLAIVGAVREQAFVVGSAWLQSLAQRVNEMTAVQSIELEALQQELISDQWRQVWAHAGFSAQITRLTLYGDVHFPSLCALTSYVSLLPNLRILAADYRRMHDLNGCHCTAPPSSLRSLRLARFAGWDTWLGMAHPGLIRSILLYATLMPVDAHALHAYLSTLGVHLQHLEIPLDPASCAVESLCIKNLVLYAHPSILPAHLYVERGSHMANVDLVPALLHAFAHTRLRNAALALAWSSDSPAFDRPGDPRTHWLALDRYITGLYRNNVACLDTFTVVLVPPVMSGLGGWDTKAFIRGVMRECQSRGILKFRDRMKNDMWIRSVNQARTVDSVW